MLQTEWWELTQRRRPADMQFVLLLLCGTDAFSFLHSNLHLFANEVATDRSKSPSSTKDRSRNPTRTCNEPHAVCKSAVMVQYFICRLAASHMCLKRVFSFWCFWCVCFAEALTCCGIAPSQFNLWLSLVSVKMIAKQGQQCQLNMLFS